MDFDDGGMLRLKKEIKPGVDESGEDGDGSELVFEFSKPGSKLKSYTMEFARPRAEMDDFSDILETAKRLLKKNMYKNIVNFSDKLPQKSENKSDWLKEIQKLIHISFIETQRLLSFPDSRSRHKYEESHRMTPTVLKYSEEFADAIREKLAEYAALSQSRDRTFPTRLVKGNGSSKPTIDEL
ncbi:MAG: hypothetical protein U9Q68_07665 [Euryarchaeota archaeon]|nr:hypothetical protein [Euryarchaeota archaeon]